MKFERVEAPFWRSKPTILIGGGPSLRGVDLKVLKGHVHSVAVKGTIFDYDWADVGFGLDSIELRLWWKRLRAVKFPVWWAVPDYWGKNRRLTFPPRCLRYLRRHTDAILSENAGVINGGGSSGFGALNFAYLKRAQTIVLFGYDYGPDDNGQWHANEQNYDPAHQYDLEMWKVWAAAFNFTVDQLAKANIDVINASPTSKIQAFKKVSIEEGIDRCLR